MVVAGARVHAHCRCLHVASNVASEAERFWQGCHPAGQRTIPAHTGGIIRTGDRASGQGPPPIRNEPLKKAGQKAEHAPIGCGTAAQKSDIVRHLGSREGGQLPNK